MGKALHKEARLECQACPLARCPGSHLSLLCLSFSTRPPDRALGRTNRPVYHWAWAGQVPGLDPQPPAGFSALCCAPPPRGKRQGGAAARSCCVAKASSMWLGHSPSAPTRVVSGPQECHTPSGTSWCWPGGAPRQGVQGPRTGASLSPPPPGGTVFSSQILSLIFAPASGLDLGREHGF